MTSPLSNPICIKDVTICDNRIRFDTDKGFIDVPCDPNANAFVTMKNATAMLHSLYDKQGKEAANISFDDLNGVL